MKGKIKGKIVLQRNAYENNIKIHCIIYTTGKSEPQANGKLLKYTNNYEFWRLQNFTIFSSFFNLF